MKKTILSKKKNYKKPINIVRNKVIKLKKANSNKILDVKSISKSFDGRPILKSISFHFHKEKFLVFLAKMDVVKLHYLTVLQVRCNPTLGKYFLMEIKLMKNQYMKGVN